MRSNELELAREVFGVWSLGTAASIAGGSLASGWLTSIGYRSRVAFHQFKCGINLFA